MMHQTITNRSRDQVMRFFADLDMVEPGLVPVSGWRPAPSAEPIGPAVLWGGVARKP